MRAIATKLGRWIVAVAAVGAVALALVGLESASAVGKGAGAARAQASGVKTVDIAHFAYHPRALTIGVGTRVAFTNSSRIAHTATRRGSFNTGHIRPGTAVVIRFTHRGSFTYHCSIHPFMHGKIVVR